MAIQLINRPGETKKWLKSIYTQIIDHSLRWVYVLALTGAILFVAIIGFQTSMIKAYKEQEGPYDVPYSPWLYAIINGIAICIFFLLLSALVLWSVQSFSKKLAVSFFLITLVGCILLDAGLFFFYPIRLFSRCSIEDFDGIMRNCRKEFSDILMVIRRGSTAILLIIVGILHGILLVYSLAVTIAILLRKKQVKYKVNGRGNGYGRSQSQENGVDCTVFHDNIELR